MSNSKKSHRTRISSATATTTESSIAVGSTSKALTPPSSPSIINRSSDSFFRFSTKDYTDEKSNTPTHKQSKGKISLPTQKRFFNDANSSVGSNSISIPSNSSRVNAVKIAIDDLNKAKDIKSRTAAITNACEEFDHIVESRHNMELKLGAANSLSSVLAMTDSEDEIRMICAALEMVFRGSRDFVRAEFFKVGSALVPLLLRLLECCERGTIKYADVSIMNISKVLLYLSRVDHVRIPLARHQGILTALSRVTNSNLNTESRILRMKVLANLANADENKLIIFERPGLIDAVLRVANLDKCKNLRESASSILMDLSSARLNQVQMARSDKLLATLVKLCVLDEVPETREYAVTALQNLAFAKENRRKLAKFGNFVILEALKKIVSSDSNYKARRRAAGALTNLACEDTADIIGSQKGLISTLALVCTKDSNKEVQQRAVVALSKIASNITRAMPCQAVILDALVMLTKNKNHASSAVAVLRMKAKVSENRTVMARHPSLVEALTKICSNVSSTIKERDDAIRTLMHLTNDDYNKEVMVNKLVLDALVQGAMLEGSGHENIRNSAVVAIERLATIQSNRKYMARHDGLLVAVAYATEREAKLEVNYSHEPLAKSLLMSLLLEM